MRSMLLFVSATGVFAAAAAVPAESVYELAYGITRLEHFAGEANGMVVMSRRENGNGHGFDVASFYLEMAAAFDRYELEHNASGEVGRPSYYFGWKEASISKRRYCDVGEAFKQERGLGPYRP